MKALSYSLVIFSSCLTATLHAEEGVPVEQVCGAAAAQMGLESPLDQRLISQCTSSLAGKKFSDAYVLTEGDAYRIEENCAEQANDAGEEKFDSVYEACVIKDVIDFLKTQAE